MLGLPPSYQTDKRPASVTLHHPFNSYSEHLRQTTFKNHSTPPDGPRPTDTETLGGSEQFIVFHQHQNVFRKGCLETLPEDDLRSVLVVLGLADPSRAESGQIGQNRPSAPHQEVSVFGAGDANGRPHVLWQQVLHLGLEPLRQAWQQSVPTCSHIYPIKWWRETAEDTGFILLCQ